jgi:hypothetical protein
MAELPRYQQTGRVFADLPQLDFANIRESFQRSRSMAAGLDKLSNFAFKEAGEAAQRDAMQAAIDQPITLEQLKEAEKSGITAEDLVKATGGGKIWQETMRKFQAEQLRSQLEVQANTQALAIKQQVEIGQLTNPDEIKAKFTALQTGMSKPLVELDPETALKFQNATASLIKNVEKAAYDKLADDYKIQQQVEASAYKLVALELSRDVMQNNADPDIINSQLAIIEQTYIKKANGGGYQYASSEINSFNKAIEDTKNNFFIMKASSVEFGTNPQTGKYDISYALKKVQAGDFGEYSESYNKIISDKKKISDDAYTLINTQYVAQKAQVDADKRMAEDVLKESIYKVYSGSLTGKAADAVIQQGFSAGIFTESQVQSYFKSKYEGAPASKSQKEQAVLAERDIIRGTIKNDADIKKYYPNLHHEDYVKSMRLLTNDDAKEAAKLHNKFSGVDADPGFTKPTTQQNYIEIRDSFEKLKEEKNPDGTFVYPTQTSAMIAANKLRMQSSEIKTNAKLQNQAYDALIGFNFNPENGGFDDWIAKQKLPESTKNTIRSTYEIWKTNSGRTRKTIQQLKDEGVI